MVESEDLAGRLSDLEDHLKESWVARLGGNGFAVARAGAGGPGEGRLLRCSVSDPRFPFDLLELGDFSSAKHFEGGESAGLPQ